MGSPNLLISEVEKEFGNSGGGVFQAPSWAGFTLPTAGYQPGSSRREGTVSGNVGLVKPASPGSGEEPPCKAGTLRDAVSPFPGGVVELYVGGRSHFSNPGPAPVGDQLPWCPLRPAGSVAGSGSHLLLKALRGMPFTVLRVSGWPLPPGTTVGFRCSVTRPRQHQTCRSASSELGGGARPGRPSVHPSRAFSVS